MNVGFVACNVGSMFLGMTMAFAVLLTLAGRNGQGDQDGTDGCLTTLLCVCGFGVALFFYVLAIAGPA